MSDVYSLNDPAFAGQVPPVQPPALGGGAPEFGTPPGAPADLPDLSILGSAPAPQTRYELLQDHVFEARQSHLEMQERIDARARARIAQQVKTARDREGVLLEKLNTAAGAFTPPPERPTTLQMRPEEIWAAGLAGLIGGNFGAGANNAAAFAGQRQEAEAANAQNAWAFDNQRATAGYEQARSEYTAQQLALRQLETGQLNTEADLAGLEGRMYQQDVADERAQRTEAQRLGNALRDDYEQAKSPGDVATTARRLAAFDKEHGTQYAPTPQETSRKIASMGESSIKAYNTRVQSIWTHAGAISDADRVALAQERQAILSTYPGIDPKRLGAVPTSEALGAARIRIQKEQFAQRMELAKDRFKWAKRNDQESLKVRWASVKVAQGNYQLAARNAELSQDRHALDIAQYYMKQLDDGTKDLAEEAAKKIRNLDAAIANKKAVAGDQRQGSMRQQAAKAEVHGLEEERKQWQGVLDETNTDRAAVGIAPLTPEEALARGREQASAGVPSPMGAGGGGMAPRVLVYTGGNNPGAPVKIGPRSTTIAEAINKVNGLIASGRMSREQGVLALSKIGITAK